MNLRRNIIVTTVARVGMLVLALASSIILARILGPKLRGIFALIMLLPEFAQSFGLFGYDQANAVYAGLEPQSRKQIVWHSLALAGGGGGTIFLGCVVYLLLGAPGLHLNGPFWLYLLAVSIVPFSVLTEYWGAVVRGMNEITLINMTDVGRRVLSVCLIVAVVWALKLGVEGAVVSEWVLNILAVVWLLILLRRLHVWGPPSFDRALLRRTTRFAFPAYVGGILSFLNYRVDQFLVAAMLPAEQLAFYAIAVGIAERLWIPAGAIATSLLPHLANDRDHDPALAAVVSRHAAMVTGLGCLAVWIFAGLGMRILYSKAYIAAAAPLRWLLPGIFTLTIAKILVAELNVQKKIDFNVWCAALAAIVNIAGNLFLIPRMGISGASLASTISYTILSIVVCWYYVHVTGVSWTTLIPRTSDLGVYVRLLRSRTRPASAAAVVVAAAESAEVHNPN